MLFLSRIEDSILSITYPLDETDIMDDGMTAMDVTGEGAPIPLSASMGKYIRLNTINSSRCIRIGSVCPDQNVPLHVHCSNKEGV